MMDSLEKVTALLDHYMDLPDEELGPMLGMVPIAVARGMMPLAPAMLPDTAQELDEQIRGLQGWLEQMLSDAPEPVAAAVPDADEA
jgi:hypothetical protein